MTKSFTFQVRVDSDVEPQELLDNTLQARWQSLPGQTTALNSTGLIGPDGSLTGLRNGAVPNLGDPINDYETTATASATVPALTTTKTDLSPATVPTIGAYKQFQIEILLPEGVSENVSVSDNLAASGIGYMLANDATYGIAYSFVGIASINGQAPGEGAFGPPRRPGPGRRRHRHCGVDYRDRGDGHGKRHRHQRHHPGDPYQLLRAGTKRSRHGRRRHAAEHRRCQLPHGETGGTQTANATAPPTIVVEPRLTLGKVVSNVTAPGNAPVVGDVLEYTVVLTNTTVGPAAATAFDVNVVDTLPANVELIPASRPQPPWKRHTHTGSWVYRHTGRCAHRPAGLGSRQRRRQP